jgi:flagellar biosynthesis protein FlhG
MLRANDQADGIRAAIGDLGHHVGPRRLFAEHTRTIAVTSGKGGVGKTQISANIAVLFAQQGKRVLLLDADLGLASLDLVLGVRPRTDLLAVVRGERDIKDVLAAAPCGVQLLPACPGRYEMANLSTAEREKLLTVLQELAVSFDVLIIDTGAGIGANSVGFAALADEVLLVATPEPTSLRDAYAMAKVLHRRNGVEKIHLIANQVSDEANGAEVYENLRSVAQRFLSIELVYLGCVPRDESVMRAVARGEPCVLGSPRSRASRALESVVYRMTHPPASTSRVVC